MPIRQAEARDVHQMVMQCGARGDQPLMAWRRLVQRQLLAGPIRRPAARLLEDQERRCDVPVVTAAPGEVGVEAACRHQRHLIGERADGADGSCREEGAEIPGLALAGAQDDVGCLQCFGRLEPQLLAVQGGPGTASCLEAFARCRIEQTGEDGLSGLDQCDGDGELGLAGDEAAGAVDRIDHPDARSLQAQAVVPRFLREPGGVGAHLAEARLERMVDREIGLGEDLARLFLPGPAALAKGRHGDVTGSLDGRAQARLEVQGVRQGSAAHQIDLPLPGSP